MSCLVSWSYRLVLSWRWSQASVRGRRRRRTRRSSALPESWTPRAPPTGVPAGRRSSGPPSSRSRQRQRRPSGADAVGAGEGQPGLVGEDDELRRSRASSLNSRATWVLAVAGTSRAAGRSRRWRAQRHQLQDLAFASGELVDRVVGPRLGAARPAPERCDQPPGERGRAAPRPGRAALRRGPARWARCPSAGTRSRRPAARRRRARRARMSSAP